MAGDDFINKQPIYCQTKQTFKIKYYQKGKTIIQNNKLEGERQNSCLDIYTKQTNEGTDPLMNRHVVRLP